MVRIVFAREFKNVFASRATMIALAVMWVIAIVAGFAGRVFLGGDDEANGAAPAPQAQGIYLEASAAELQPYLEGAGFSALPTTNIAAELAAEEPEAEIGISGTALDPQIVATSPNPKELPALKKILSTYVLEQSGVDATVLAHLDTINNLQVQTVNYTPSGIEANPIGFLIGSVSAMLIFFMVMGGIGAVGAGVVEEKSSRVVEIILTTVRPRVLLLGKVLGLGAGWVVILFGYIGAIITGVAISGLVPDLSFLQEFGLAGMVARTVLWMVLGYFTATALVGGLAATVSRQEDLAGINTPVMFVQFIPFYTAIYLIPALPEAAVTKILSVLPFFGPFMMPMRAAIGEVPLVEELAAVGINALGVFLLAILAGKIYERSILRMGERVKLTQIFRKAA